MKKLLFLLMTVMLAAGIFCACNNKIVITTGFNDDDLFKISGKAISLKESMIIFLNEKEGYDKGLDDEFWNIKYNGKTMFQYFKDKAKEQIIKLNVLAEYAKKENISLSDEENEIIKKISKAYIEKADKDVLEKYGIKEADVVSVITKIMLVKELYVETVNNYEVEISDEEARIMYANYIVVDADKENAKEVINEISGKLAEGSDLKSIVEKYEYATYYEGYLSRQDFDKAGDVVFELKNGELSEIIESRGKLYIVKCINDYDEAMTSSNKQILLEKMKNDEFSESYKPFENSLDIEFNDKLWEDIKLDENSDKVGVNLFDLIEEVTEAQ